MMLRLSAIKSKHILTEGFFSTLSHTLYLHFGSSARASRIMGLLNQLTSPKVFLIDEFLSINTIDMKKLRHLGHIIYLSQDFACNRFGFGDNLVTKNLMFRLEQNAIPNVDLVIACSEMERLKYMQMGSRKAISYPNIYPTREFKPSNKDEIPSISIVLRPHWGPIAEESLETVFNALACLKRQVRVYMIGMRPKKFPKNVMLEHKDFLPTRLEYLKILSKSWIGINIGIHMAGTNERKYDYAEAGTIVCSDVFGARGDLLPHEYAYVDCHDLAAKLDQLLDFGKLDLAKKGEENRKLVLLAAEKGRQRLLDYISKILV